MSSAEHSPRNAVILLADDNPADQRLIRRILDENLIHCDLRIVNDGQEALDYLKQQGKYSDPNKHPRPNLLLLDINMPKLDGIGVLRAVKQDPDLAIIPTVMLTTSQQEEDVVRSYRLGCNSFVTKPVEIPNLIQALKQLGTYWLQLVVLPNKG